MTDDPFGPFSVAPSSIALLGQDFTPFVNELIRAEAADAGLQGGSVITTGLENVGDGGVDALVESSAETRYLPKGKSAWQFKAGDLKPAECTAELRGASYALEVLRAGGAYRLVVGADINAKKVTSRRKALADEAYAQGITVGPDTIKVFNASDLAAWASEYPSLAVSPFLGGIAPVAANFAAWSASTGLTETWVPNRSADEVAAAVDKLVNGTGTSALHVEGVSGLGKTRAVLEALRGKPCEPLVAYVHAVDSMPPGLVRQLHQQGRHTVIVVDECDSRAHENLAHQILVGSKVRLLTIGTPSGYQPRAEVHRIGPVDDQAMSKVLRLNQPALPVEAARVVAAAAAGNVKLALLLANDLARSPRPSGSLLITPEIIGSYVTRSLPSGTGLLACAALALFTSVGFDADLAAELQVIGTGLGLGVLDLRAAAADLDRDGLLSRQGRFRSVSPHPLAIYLASVGWEQFGGQIASELVPSLDATLTERLLQRAADIGEFDPVRQVVAQLLAPGGRFGGALLPVTCERDAILVQLAVLAPGVIGERLAAELAALDDDGRNTVVSEHPEVTWTLEKLAWHDATFRLAADGLLSLAVAAVGRDIQPRARSWTDLFGLMLPATSASPAARMQYLADTAENTNGRVRQIAVGAAARALSVHESVIVSAEVQGGFLVADRGLPATYGEAWDYSGQAMDVLAKLGGDPDNPQVSDAAVSALVALIHPYLLHVPLRERLAAAITRLPAGGLTRARTQIGHLRALFGRTQGNPDTADRQAALQAFAAMLPNSTPEEAFDALANANRWDFDDRNEFQRRLDDAARALPDASRTEHILEVAAVRPAAALELGRTLSTLGGDREKILARLVSQAGEGSIDPLVGYLLDCVDKGAPSAFDDLLDSGQYAGLDDAAMLAITVCGPQTLPGWQRAVRLAQRLSPWQATRGLIGWHTGLGPDRLTMLLDDWMSRLESQDDYNAVVDFTGLAVSRLPPWEDNLDPAIASLVALRVRYPRAGNQDWEWTQLARRQLGQQPRELHDTLLVLLESDAYIFFEGAVENDEEEGILRDTIRANGPDGWRKTMDRLAESPRLQGAFRGWLAKAVDPADAEGWVGTDPERARLLARVAAPGGDQIEPVARFLLMNFGGDKEVVAALGLNYAVRSWIGNDSAQYQARIDQLAGWASDPAEPEQVKGWARSMTAKLIAERDKALQREEELGW